MRDIRTLNQSSGQQIESDEVITRIGNLAFRNLGSAAKMGLFDSGKALIVGSGLRVEASAGLTVKVPTGCVFQRSYDVIGCIQPTEQTVTIDAASGVPRIDIVEAQIKQIVDKTDYAQIGTVATGTGGGSVIVTNEEIKRDIKYYLAVQKKTNTTTPTAATAGTLTGTVAIPGVIDLSAEYLINISDGEDGSFQEIDCRGAVPNATTRAEIMAAINAAVGRTMATAGGGDVIILTGPGLGITSKFTIKPPVTDPDKDALQTIFGVSSGGMYKYVYAGVNEWFKLCEIDMGAATVVITDALIRNVDRKSTWASDIEETLVHDYAYQPNLPEWNAWSSTITYGAGAVAWVDDEQFVSLVAANLNNHPITSPDHWQIAPSFNEVCKMFHDARPISAGLNVVDDVNDAAYQQWHLMGYYSKGGKNFEAYKVHLDGSQITGDADLVRIFDVGGGNEYFNLDLLAPDVMGVRTLPDLEGRLLRSCATGGTAVASVEEDRMQGHYHNVEITGTLDNRIYIHVGAGSAGTAAPGAPGAEFAVARAAITDGVNGTPRTGATTRDRTYIVGIAYLVVLLEV
jgi:hypothetical protein